MLLLQTGCRFVAANLYAKSVRPPSAIPVPRLMPRVDSPQVFGEDALLNISVEREASGAASAQLPQLKPASSLVLCMLTETHVAQVLSLAPFVSARKRRA